MTEKQYNKFRAQYPDAVILERIESETDENIIVRYAAYGNDADTIFMYATPSSCGYTNMPIDGNLRGQITFAAKYLEEVVHDLTRNMKKVVFVSCKGRKTTGSNK